MDAWYIRHVQRHPIHASVVSTVRILGSFCCSVESKRPSMINFVLCVKKPRRFLIPETRSWRQKRRGHQCCCESSRINQELSSQAICFVRYSLVVPAHQPTHPTPTHQPIPTQPRFKLSSLTRASRDSESEPKTNIGTQKIYQNRQRSSLTQFGV